MDKDTAARGARYFGAPNVAYEYGPNTPEILDVLREFKRVTCPLSRHCRSVEVPDEVEEARRVSRLSLAYPNIVGAIIDDLSCPPNFPCIAGQMKALWRSLHVDNPGLKLYGVVYTQDLEAADYAPILPWLDGVNLWVWNPEDLPKLAADIERTKRIFPGKPILQGLFIHDYVHDPDDSRKLAVPMDAMKYQFETAAGLLRTGKVDGIVILGDREIAKHPAEAEWIRGFLAAEFR
jgi:hypothetical protein